jgi:glucosamine--fructose-6-phosphate aminotransferase (isomerizing)
MLAKIELGQQMAAEIEQSPDVFSKRVSCTVDLEGQLDDLLAIYTIARGSSDAAANILSYELMRELQLPVTSLPPSVFSLGTGVCLDRSACLLISQSGASEDLVKSAHGARSRGAKVVALTNQPGSAVQEAADICVPINAGPELAVPATKTVIGSIAAGMAILAAQSPDYAAICKKAAAEFANIAGRQHPQYETIVNGLIRSQHIYVIGRDTGLGAAQEVALKLKDCCALHAEAYSASEVLHGPLQLVTKPLTVLLLDTGLERTTKSLDRAEDRFRASGAKVFRISPLDVGVPTLSPAASAAILLYLAYPIVRQVALALGLDPDTPHTLSKVTNTL